MARLGLGELVSGGFGRGRKPRKAANTCPNPADLGSHDAYARAGSVGSADLGRLVANWPHVQSMRGPSCHVLVAQKLGGITETGGQAKHPHSGMCRLLRSGSGGWLAGWLAGWVGWQSTSRITGPLSPPDLLPQERQQGGLQGLASFGASWRQQCLLLLEGVACCYRLRLVLMRCTKAANPQRNKHSNSKHCCLQLALNEPKKPTPEAHPIAAARIKSVA